MSEIQFLHIADIPEPPDGYALAASSVSNGGAGLFLFVDEQKLSQVFARYEDPDGASFPETRVAESADAQFVEVTSNAVTRTDLRGIDLAFPMIDSLPDGQILVAGARAERHEDGTCDLNGQVFAPNGSLSRRFLLGDGIARLACDGHGRIWVSYFDEGVYGNLGWGDADEPAPFGAAGLACFDGDGRVLWKFAADGADGEQRYIDDCYAMNVGNDEVWIYYYSDFDLCEIDAGSMELTSRAVTGWQYTGTASCSPANMAMIWMSVISARYRMRGWRMFAKCDLSYRTSDQMSAFNLSVAAPR